MTKNKKELVAILGVKTFEECVEKLNNLGIELPKRITSKFIETVRNAIASHKNAEVKEVKMDKWEAKRWRDAFANIIESELYRYVSEHSFVDLYLIHKKSGKFVKFVSFVEGKVTHKRSTYTRKVLLNKHNFPYMSDEYIVAREVNLYGGEYEYHISTKHIALEDLKAKVLYNGKYYSVPVTELLLEQDGKSLYDALASVEIEQKKEVVRYSDGIYYHQTYGLVKLLTYSSDFVTTDEYSNKKTFVLPTHEEENLSILPYAITEDEYGSEEADDSSDEHEESSVEAQRIKEVFVQELLHVSGENEIGAPSLGVDLSVPENADLYYNIEKITDEDERGYIRSHVKGISELLYVIKDLPPKVVKIGGKVKKVPQVLAMGEESKRLYILNPVTLYRVTATNANASLKELRYQYTDPTSGVTVVASYDGVTVEAVEEDDASFYGGSYERVSRSSFGSGNTSKEKVINIKPEHIAKHKLDIPELEYQVKLNYDLKHNAILAVVTFKSKNSTFFVKYVYNANTRSVEPQTNFSVETEKTKNFLTAMKHVVSLLWHKHKQQQQKQAR
ncbi:MAG: hypothetical protein N2043_01400 [Ignavibacterium sp.]|nr:hypothetical protein [Ignavibacterium sp.]